VRVRLCVAVVALASSLPVAWGVGSDARAQAVPNPPIEESCGVDVTLVLDASGSISNSGAVEDVRDAAEAFLDALANTNSTARVTQFATVSEELAPSTLVDDASLAEDGVHGEAITGYYHPKPPRPPGVSFHQYRGAGDPQSPSSWVSGSSDQYTNWDQSLDQAGTGPSELVVFVTDGDPTAYDFNEPGDPFDPGPPPDVGYSTDREPAATVTLDRAVAEAEAIKTTGTRMLTVGVGSALSNQASVDRLVAVTGDQVVRDADLADIDSLNEVDVALVTDFEDLAAFLRSVVLQLCSPSLTIRKLAQSADSANYLPAPGWDMTVEPTVPGGTFDWILPDTTSAASKTVATNADGFAQFQWEPDPAEADSEATVTETLEPGFVAGRPDDDDFRCELRDEAGNVRSEAGELDGLAFELDPIGQEIVTCTVWNSFDYAPEIAITKVNSPTAVRGDAPPPSGVTSTYEVTNPGNTPLDKVRVTDDKCATVTAEEEGGFNVGDEDEDRLLDPDEAETWLFTCVRTSLTRRGRAAPANVVNTATAYGTDPAGTTVTDQAPDDVDIYVPAIEVVKLVNGADLVTVAPGAATNYTYAVTNTGATPLGTVTLTDDTPPCTAPIPDPGNTPPPLLPDQTWNYTCSTTATEDVLNTATVTGIPLNPQDGNAPFEGPNPPVTASDPAEVQVLTPGIYLTKEVEPGEVLLSPAVPTPPEAVTYTFAAQNTGTAPLDRPDGTSPLDPGWVTDEQCNEPAEFVGGDTNGNALLDPGEVWEFTCPGSVTEPTLNLAEIEGQPVDGDGNPIGDPITDFALAFVDVLRPGIDVVKTALVSVVLDENLTPRPISGLDADESRPAFYLYELTNTGNVPLSLERVHPSDDTCPELVFDPLSDVNGDGLLDVDETWTYTCETTLDREGDSNTPPVTGHESGLVTNNVTVTGDPFFEGATVPEKFVTATASDRVQVIEPGISITKDVSAPVVLPDGDVTYTFLVTNTGDVGLRVIGPEDDKCTELTFVGGDRPPFNELLDGANSGSPEVWTYECTRAIGAPEPPATTDVNTVTAQGVDTLGNLYEDSDSAEVRVFDPAIALTKVVDHSLVPVGTEVNYSFEVTNVGTSPLPADDVLAEVLLRDVSEPALPTCAEPAFVGGDGNGNDLLDREPFETWTYQCAATITEPTTNLAVVRGTGGTTFDPELPVDVFDAAPAFVQTFQPAIEVTKTATPTRLVGSGEVEYTYEVRNTGDVPLAGVAERITDDTCSPVSYVSGDQDEDGLLDTPTSIFEDALDETWTFTCTVTLSETTTNTVVVTGTPTDPGGVALCGGEEGEGGAAQVPEPCDVTDDDQATVTVVDPGTITIRKRTPGTTGARFDFTLDDTDFRLAGGEERTFEGLEPGTYTVTETAKTRWRLRNLVCEDETEDTVIDLEEGQAVIELAPGESVTCTFVNRPRFAGEITIAKETTVPTSTEFDFEIAGIDFTLGDGDDATFVAIEPGTYRVAEAGLGGWTLQSLVCVDTSDDTTVDVSGRSAAIQVSRGDTIRCTFTNRPAGRLPETGSSGVGGLLTAGGVLVAGGAALVVLARRRRARAHT
jgi:LPXTG-motif cell wall-anchored protein